MRWAIGFLWLIGLVFLLLIWMRNRVQPEIEPISSETSLLLERKKQFEADLKVAHFLNPIWRNAESYNATTVTRAYDMKAFGARVLKEFENPSVYEKMVTTILRLIRDKPGGLGAELMERKYKFLRFVEIGDHRVPLFRAVSKSGTLDYIGFLTEESEDNGLKIVDHYAYSFGAWSSQVIYGTISPISDVSGAELEALRGYRAAIQGGDYPKILSNYPSLPESWRRNRYFWAIYTNFLFNRETQFQQALKLESAYPDDAGAAILVLNPGLALQKWVPVRQRVDFIDEVIGGDPFLDVYRSGCFLNEENLPEALKCAERAVNGCEEMTASHHALFEVLHQLKEFEALSDALKIYKKRFDDTVVLRTLRSRYPAFADSEEGEELLREWNVIDLGD